MTFASNITLYTRSLVAIFVPFRSKISPLLNGITLLSYCCYSNTIFVYFSPFDALIYVILPIKTKKASTIAPNSITSFFCIFLGNFCRVYCTPRFFFDIVSPLFFYFIRTCKYTAFWYVFIFLDFVACRTFVLNNLFRIGIYHP